MARAWSLLEQEPRDVSGNPHPGQHKDTGPAVDCPSLDIWARKMYQARKSGSATTETEPMKQLLALLTAVTAYTVRVRSALAAAQR